MIYSPTFPKPYIQEKLSKLRKLKYNQFRWWRMYDNPVLPLPNKAPLIEKILNGEQPRDLKLQDMLVGKFPLLWQEQKELWGF